jgi:signal transduction histidine kinase
LIIIDIWYKVNFVHQNLAIIIITCTAYIGLSYYLVLMLERLLLDQQEKNKYIREQNQSLNSANKLLTERQVMIQEQSKHIISQTEELKAKNEELALLISSKDMFLSIIAHDLKNPINLIKGYSEILRARYERIDDSHKLQYIESIENTTRHTYNLLENLLSWARAQSNAIVIYPDKINLNAVIPEIIMLFRDTLKDKKINFDFNPGELFLVTADNDMLSTVIRNLISNAVKFTFPGGNISIDLFRYDKEIEIVVSDDGIGMDANEVEKLFKIDKYISTSGTIGEGGSGLGLILCKLFVEKNKGRIQVMSEKNKGSRFSVFLPEE